MLKPIHLANSDDIGFSRVHIQGGKLVVRLGIGRSEFSPRRREDGQTQVPVGMQKVGRHIQSAVNGCRPLKIVHIARTVDVQIGYRHIARSQAVCSTQRIVRRGCVDAVGSDQLNLQCVRWSRDVIELDQTDVHHVTLNDRCPDSFAVAKRIGIINRCPEIRASEQLHVQITLSRVEHRIESNNTAVRCRPLVPIHVGSGFDGQVGIHAVGGTQIGRCVGRIVGFESVRCQKHARLEGLQKRPASSISRIPTALLALLISSQCGTFHLFNLHRQTCNG